MADKYARLGIASLSDQSPKPQKYGSRRHGRPAGLLKKQHDSQSLPIVL